MWIDVGRRDVRLAGVVDTLDAEPPRPPGRCSAPGCQRDGEHDGMCGRHFWQVTAHEREPRPATRRRTSVQDPVVVTGGQLSPRYERLAAAYILAADLLARLPEHRWVILWRAIEVSPPVLRRVRKIVTVAAELPESGIKVDGETHCRIMVTDRAAALRSIREAALATHYWRQAVTALLAAETALS